MHWKGNNCATCKWKQLPNFSNNNRHLINVILYKNDEKKDKNVLLYKIIKKQNKSNSKYEKKQHDCHWFTDRICHI